MLMGAKRLARLFFLLSLLPHTLAGTGPFDRRWTQMNADKRRAEKLLQSDLAEYPLAPCFSGLASFPHLRPSAFISG